VCTASVLAYKKSNQPTITKYNKALFTNSWMANTTRVLCAPGHPGWLVPADHGTHQPRETCTPSQMLTDLCITICVNNESYNSNNELSVIQTLHNILPAKSERLCPCQQGQQWRLVQTCRLCSIRKQPNNWQCACWATSWLGSHTSDALHAMSNSAVIRIPSPFAVPAPSCLAAPQHRSAARTAKPVVLYLPQRQEPAVRLLARLATARVRLP
jgi:hypothetical protein